MSLRDKEKNNNNNNIIYSIGETYPDQAKSDGKLLGLPNTCKSGLLNQSEPSMKKPTSSKEMMKIGDRLKRKDITCDKFDDKRVVNKNISRVLRKEISADKKICEEKVVRGRPIPLKETGVILKREKASPSRIPRASDDLLHSRRLGKSEEGKKSVKGKYIVRDMKLGSVRKITVDDRGMTSSVRNLKEDQLVEEPKEMYTPEVDKGMEQPFLRREVIRKEVREEKEEVPPEKQPLAVSEGNNFTGFFQRLHRNVKAYLLRFPEPVAPGMEPKAPSKGTE